MKDPLKEILNRFFNPETDRDAKAIEDFKCEFVALHFFNLTNFRLKYFIDIDYEIPQEELEHFFNACF